MASQGFKKIPIFLILSCLCIAKCATSFGQGSEIRVEIEADQATELAPHRKGNVYAPTLWNEGGLRRIWYGGQGRDGHDRIHYTESQNGGPWLKKGVVIDNGRANHVNDPSVVKIGETFFLYYTIADKDVVDAIALATSTDGIHWQLKGKVLEPGHPGAWDSLLVGRPSVIHHNGTFHLYYDGRKDLNLGSPAQGVPKSANSRRFVGLATSMDGLHWRRSARNPVFDHDAGGVDVKITPNGYIMLYESGAGTMAAVSSDGTNWRDRGILIPKTHQSIDRFGHVTPTYDLASGRIYFGAARASTWDQNTIASLTVASTLIDRLFKNPGNR
jgi:hypothetical protein